jgi:hypothetical protein
MAKPGSEPGPGSDRGKLQDPFQIQAETNVHRNEALKKDYSVDDASGERKCLKESGRADLKGERETVVAEISLTGQQVQTEESTGEKAANQLPYSTEKRAVNPCFNNLAMILSSLERSEIQVRYLKS